MSSPFPLCSSAGAGGSKRILPFLSKAGCLHADAFGEKRRAHSPPKKMRFFSGGEPLASLLTGDAECIIIPLVRALIFCFFLPFFSLSAHALPAETAQAIIGIADGWDSSQVQLSFVEKEAGRWKRVMGPVPGRLGEKGLVWGLGLHANPKGCAVKREGDGRSPAGIFAIGGLWTTRNDVKVARGIPVVRVCDRDLWVSDVASPYYNRHVRLNHPASTPWEKKEMMRLNDYAHSIKLLICHNTQETNGRPVRGAGSSIFFHIWRREGRAATAGCTSMSESNLRSFLQRLRPESHPVYILLPGAEYVRLRSSWQLP